MYLKEIGWEVVISINLSQECDQCQADVKTVMNILVHKIFVITLAA
jgi:hypothetical protein